MLCIFMYPFYVNCSVNVLYLYMVRLGPTIVGKVRGTNALTIIIIIIITTFVVFECQKIHVSLELVST